MANGRVFSILLAILPLLCAPISSRAHEEYDHEPAAAAPAADTEARVGTELTSERYEAVIVSHGDHLDIWLDRFETNEPVAGAKVSVVLDQGTAREATEEAPGQYMVEIEPLAAGAVVALTLTVSAAAGTARLGGTLEVPAGPDATQGAAAWLSANLLWIGIVVGALGLLIVILLRRRRPASAGFAASGVAVIHAALAASALCAATPAAAGSRPMRLPDGIVFVPKATQRILEVRTQVARPSSAPLSVKLVGEIVGEPRASAELQTLQGGRVEAAAADRWPRLGATVKRDQILLRLTPAGSGAERAGSAAELARLEAELAQARRDLQRLRDLEGVVSRGELEAAQTRERSLAGQRAAIAGTARGGEVLRAPIAGVIAALDVRPGQIAEPGRTLIKIVDPQRLGVEALAFEPIEPTEIRAASINLRDGRALPARLDGIGSQLAGGARTVRLSLASAAPGLAIGEPVVAWLERRAEQPALVLPLEALVRLPNGETVVYEKLSAERFAPRNVRHRQIAADRVAVLAGVAAEARIVTRGAALLTQIR